MDCTGLHYLFWFSFVMKSDNVYTITDFLIGWHELREKSHVGIWNSLRILRPMQTDATSHNIVVCCWGFLANNVASVCMGLKVKPVSNYTQQVPTLSRFHANGRNTLGPTMLRVVGQQCCVRLYGLFGKKQRCSNNILAKFLSVNKVLGKFCVYRSSCKTHSFL